MPSKIIGSIEIVVLILCTYFGYAWTQDPDGNYEPWLFLGGLVFLALEVLRRYEIHFIKREGKELTPGELVKHSEDLRQQFQDEIYRCKAQELRKDVIIRHVNRIDSYPEINEKDKGISPCIRRQCDWPVGDNQIGRFPDNLTAFIRAPLSEYQWQLKQHR